MKNSIVAIALLAVSQFVIAQQQNGACLNCNNGTSKKGNAPSPQDGNQVMGLTYQKDTCGLNMVRVSVNTQTRYTATPGTGFPTTANVAGIPNCPIILKAYLYYISSYQSPQPPVSTVSITNPNSQNGVFPSTLIGQDGSKCWGETGTAVYRSDVTSNISGNGSYAIDITGFNNKNWEIDGITLLIIYRDPLATYQGSIVLWDGAHTGIGSQYNQTMQNVNACAASSGTAIAFMMLSDMQSNINGGQHPTTLNGATANYPNAFWCWDQVNTAITANQTTAQFGTDGLGSDCFTVGLIGLYYQTTTCVTCTPVAPSAITVNTTSTPSVCNQPNGTATATPSGGTPPYTYLWNTTPPQTTQVATGLTPGTYIVNVIDATGCALGTDTVIVGQLSLTDTLFMSVAFCDGDTSAVLYAPQGFGGYQWYYDNTPINGATGDSIIINPANLPHYNVDFLLNGCIRHTSLYVTSIPAPYFLPDSTANVFSPNGDNKNDIFYPYISRHYSQAGIDYYAKEFKMQIFDRWGKLMYETTDYVPQWDGKYNGKPASEGTYFWICTYISRCEPGKTVSKKGYVQLIR